MITRHKNILIIVSLVAVAGLAIALSGNVSSEHAFLSACGAKAGAGCAPAAAEEHCCRQDCACEACDCATVCECKDCACESCACAEGKCACCEKCDAKGKGCKKHACKT